MFAGSMGGIRLIGERRSKPGTGPGALRRTLRHLGGQITMLIFFALDIGSLGLALFTPAWLMPWLAMNLTALVLATLRCSDDNKLQRQAEEERAARTRREVEQAERLSRVEQELREAERGRGEAVQERDARRQQQLEAAERLRQLEQELREAEQARRRADEECHAQRRQHGEQAERLRQLEEELRAAERDRRQAELRCEAGRERVQAAVNFRKDWWSVLGVAPSTTTDEIVRNYRRRIKQYHPDRVVGLAPEFIELAEEHTKALNQAYENAMRTRQ